MSSFKERLLTEVSGLCEQLFTQRIALVRTQQLVSEKSKEDIRLLIMELDTLRHLTPFPDENGVDKSPLEQLKTDLANTDDPPEDGQEVLMNWVKAFRPGTTTSLASDAPPVITPPLNQRMIDSLAELRSEIDKTRIRLLRTGDHYDRPAYTAARNAFTLARSVYTERLRLNQVSCTNEEVATVEQELTSDVATATGSNFPDTIQAAADFMATRVFAVA
ncbi:MAG: hypothetical protein AAGF89_00095 [Bacteroidota bacterium]